MPYLLNNTVNFSFIDDKYIVCYGRLGSFSLKFIQNIETDKKIIVRDNFKSEELMIQKIKEIISNMESEQ